MYERHNCTYATPHQDLYLHCLLIKGGHPLHEIRSNPSVKQHSVVRQSAAILLRLVNWVCDCPVMLQDKHNVIITKWQGSYIKHCVILIWLLQGCTITIRIITRAVLAFVSLWVSALIFVVSKSQWNITQNKTFVGQTV